MTNVSFCVLWATGSDTTIDGVFRVQAARRSTESGAWETFDTFCNPFADEPGNEASTSATARMVREFGVTGADLEGMPTGRECWPDLERFLGVEPLLVPDAEGFEAWAAHLAGKHGSHGVAIGLCEAAALFFPGRLANRREALVLDLVGDASTRSQRAFGPRELAAAWTELIGRFLERDDATLELFCAGAVRAWEGLAVTDPRAAQRLSLLLELVERPSAWARSGPGELAFRALPSDGRLARALETELYPEQLLERVRPRCAVVGGAWAGLSNLPPDSEEDMPFADEDMRLLDDVFSVHLPAIFAADTGTAEAIKLPDLS